MLADAADGSPQVLLMATGSELSIAVEAWRQLGDQGIAARVVSLPSMEFFEDQQVAYRNEVIPPSVTARIAIEAGVRQGWDRYLGPEGTFVGMQGFGASAPYATIYQELGITVEHVVAEAQRMVGK